MDKGGYVRTEGAQECVKHSVGEHVHEMTHNHAMEFFWSTNERSDKGVFNEASKKHLDHPVQEFVACHSLRECDAMDIMTAIA